MKQLKLPFDEPPEPLWWEKMFPAPTATTATERASTAATTVITMPQRSATTTTSSAITSYKFSNDDVMRQAAYENLIRVYFKKKYEKANTTAH